MPSPEANHQPLGRLPVVSVLMPAHNEARFIRAAMDSVLAQTFTDFEFVVVDDGSTDGTAEILAEYASRDERVRVLTHRENVGIVAALNGGLVACKGRYVARMDADDVAVEDRLSKQVAFMEANDDVIALGGALTYIDAADRELGVTRRCTVGQPILRQCPLLHPTVMLRREPIVANGFRYRERFRHAEDYFFWMEVSRCGRLAAIDDVVLRYRIRGGATRMRHLKSMLWSTLKAKAVGVATLHIRPGLGDVLRFAAECVLLAVPSPIVRWIYLRKTFGKRRRIDL